MVSEHLLMGMEKDPTLRPKCCRNPGNKAAAFPEKATNLGLIGV